MQARTGFAGWQWVVVAMTWAAFPLMLVLNALRPDLMIPMLDHTFGHLMLMGTVLFSLGGMASAMGLFALSNVAGRSPASRLTLWVAGSLVPMILCALPACALVLFGPIVFALVSGGVP